MPSMSGPSWGGPRGPGGRLVPQVTLRPVHFVCQAPQARAVSWVGDFNRWEGGKHPMRKGPDQAWFVTLELPHGHHRYAFLVDGVLTLDPRAQGVARNDHGQRVSLIPVS